MYSHGIASTSNNACAELKQTVPQFTSSAAATQRASALCGFVSLYQSACCCLGAVHSSGDTGVKPPDNQRQSSGGNHNTSFTSIYTSNTSPGEDKLMFQIGTIDQQSLHACCISENTQTPLLLEECFMPSTCFGNSQCNDFSIASFQIHCACESAS